MGARFLFEPRADVLHYASRSFASWRRTPYQYGRYDVVMGREKGINTFELACHEFERRHAWSRWLTRACVGPVARPAMVGLFVAAVAADRLGLENAASFALSAIFNLQYWQGASDELGGRPLERRRRAVAGAGVAGARLMVALSGEPSSGGTAGSMARPLRVGFVMSTEVGLRTQYLNWRECLSPDMGVDPTWAVIEWRQEGGLLERLPLLPVGAGAGRSLNCGVGWGRRSLTCSSWRSRRCSMARAAGWAASRM